MRTAIGIGLLLLSIPYAITGATREWGASTSMGTLALIVAGGIMLARGRKTQRTELAAVPAPSPPQAPAVSAKTDTPPPMHGDDAEPMEAVASGGTTDLYETMLPPPPDAPAPGRPHLRLVYSDGIRLTPQQLRRKVK